MIPKGLKPDKDGGLQLKNVFHVVKKYVDAHNVQEAYVDRFVMGILKEKGYVNQQMRLMLLSHKRGGIKRTKDELLTA